MNLACKDLTDVNFREVGGTVLSVKQIWGVVIGWVAQASLNGFDKVSQLVELVRTLGCQERNIIHTVYIALLLQGVLVSYWYSNAT